MSEQVAAPGESPESPTGARRASGRAVDVLTVLGLYAGLGVVCGLLWWWLWEPAAFTKGDSGGAMGEIELQKVFNADGWFTVIAVVAGLLAGFLVTLWRSRDLILTTILVAVGAGIAAGVMAWTGHLLGPGDPDTALRSVDVGAQVPVQLELRAKVGYLVWPIASLVGALVVLWSPQREEQGDGPDA